MEWEKKFNLERENTARHVDFCVKLCILQMAEGRYFLFEHPRSATSWSMTKLAGLCKDPRVETVNADQCAFGLTSTKHGIVGPAKKPTKFASNSRHLLNELEKRCSNDHAHVHLHEGRAADAARYPEGLCRSICKGLSRQLKSDMMSTIGSRQFKTSHLALMICSARRIWLEHWKEDMHEPDGNGKMRDDEN